MAQVLPDIRVAYGLADLIIVPAFFGDPDVIFSKHRALVDWLGTMHGQGFEMASLCSGAFFLGEAGLLTGKMLRGFAHWRAHQTNSGVVIPTHVSCHVWS